jgi:hypothetical protein
MPATISPTPDDELSHGRTASVLSEPRFDGTAVALLPYGKGTDCLDSSLARSLAA